jgi:hypothetical protein
MTEEPSERVRKLNDGLRKTGIGGRVLLTRGVLGFGLEFAVAARRAVAGFDEFDDDNDPYGEHNFGQVQVGGHRLMFKIDYYDLAIEAGSEDPGDPNVTTRVLTIMLSNEY